MITFSHLLIWQLILISLPASLLLAAGFLPYLIFFSLLWSRHAKKMAYWHLAGQLAKLGGGLICLLLVAIAAAGFYHHLYNPNLLTGSFRPLLLTLLGLVAFNVACALILLLRPHSVLAALTSSLGMTFLLGLLAAIVRAVFLPRFIQATSDLPLDVYMALFFPHDGNDIVYGLFLILPFFAISCGGAISLLWLVIKRNFDDFGRDYYQTAGRYLSTWALLGSLALACTAVYAMGLLLLSLQVANREIIWIFLLGAVFFPFSIAIIYAIIVRSQNPMRHKFLMLLGLIALLVFAFYAADLFVALPGSLNKITF